jgi:hypothetical protein
VSVFDCDRQLEKANNVSNKREIENFDKFIICLYDAKYTKSNNILALVPNQYRKIGFKSGGYYEAPLEPQKV